MGSPSCPARNANTDVSWIVLAKEALKFLTFCFCAKSAYFPSYLNLISSRILVSSVNAAGVASSEIVSNLRKLSSWFNGY